ncbi:hypothetical protein CGCF415_v011266 [Colletotrichum fructicola]|uniref:Uncharacterized protein n=1 Tax=Colletotrichum fructicola (strain Nara gc5) TaxID=1213859 RepID=L2FM96_COLFN|nr:hypothetical protein CGGC5_v014676 [Colletotrichum fructicola Nara gc5]KAF4887276.1 hypothetical protein CGCFRS4_v010609 [Colletotrichum fructicola]KAF4897264.1 hypothetical protein CGCF415_v011266 [Colletotrichum fructicola]KAF4930569.1 hypothetical protein CGCF245_v011589 [Colletotrichum fructicola]
MSSDNPYPPYGSSLREAKLQLWRQGSGSYCWGFYVYRTTYDDQELWERYLTYIYQCIDNTLKFQSKFDRERLRRHFRLTIIEDPSLANVSPEYVRQKFMKWVSSLPPRGDQPGGDQQGELPPEDHRDPIRFAYPLYVDSECLNSLLAHDKELEKTGYEFAAHRLVFIKAINAEQPQVHSGAEVDDDDEDEEADESEKNDDEEKEDDENNGHEEVTDDPGFYWMLVTCRYLGVYWEIMGLGGQWERQSSSFRHPQKRPWKEI